MHKVRIMVGGAFSRAQRDQSTPLAQRAWFQDSGASMSDTYLVWSNEHRAWRKPGGYGYSTGLDGAGRFSRERAIEICRDALMTAAHIGIISEIPVRLDDIADVLRDRPVPAAVVKSRNE